MREMKTGQSSGSQETPLAVKASLPHTFRGMGLFMELGLLFWGCYLLANAMLKPLEANSVSVISGGGLLALASVLLFYLAWPTRTKSISQSDQAEEAVKEETILVYRQATQEHREGNWVLEKKEGLPGPM